MELMSSLLLCALVALLPQALGFRTNYLSEVKRDVPKRIEPPSFRKTVWLRRKIPSESTIKSVLQYLRATEECSMCMDCINHALHTINDDKTTESSAQHVRSRDFILNDIIENYDQYNMVRNRRGIENKITTKSKRSQVLISKNVTVSKYTVDGQVYAIKLREKNSTNAELQQGQSCHVYSVRKHFPCESPLAESIFTSAKKKAKKRISKQARNTLTTGKPRATGQARGTRQDKVLAESFMTSIEELYN